MMVWWGSVSEFWVGLRVSWKGEKMTHVSRWEGERKGRNEIKKLKMWLAAGSVGGGRADLGLW